MKHSFIVFSLSFSLSLSFVLYILTFSSDVFASYIIESPQEMKDSCLKLKQNGFKDQDPISRLTNLYLNSLLDYIVDNNKDLIKEKGLENQKFCILFNEERIKTSSTGCGLIFFHIQHLVFPFEEDDADISSLISHELAHELIDHDNSSNSIVNDIYKEFKQNIDPQIDVLNSKDDLLKFEKYCKEHPKFIEEMKKHEIAADELGFKLYLNSGFTPEKYGLFFLKATEEVIFSKLFKNDKSQTIFSELSDEEFLLFKKISTTEGCLSLGNIYYENNNLDYFMNKIKYIPNFKDPHPSGCFRYWNIEKKMREHDSNIFKDNTVLNSIFLKLDLSKYEHLDNFIEYVLKKDTKKLNDTLKDIFKDIIYNPSSNINYTVDLNSKKESISIINGTWNIKFYKYLIKPILKAKYELIRNKNKNKNKNIR